MSYKADVKHVIFMLFFFTFRMELTPDHGYVFFAVSYAVILNFWLSSNVMKARKQYKVEYPAIYHKDPMHVFNCYQVLFSFLTLIWQIFSALIKILWNIFHLLWFNSWLWRWSTQNGPQFASQFGSRPGNFLSHSKKSTYFIFLDFSMLTDTTRVILQSACAAFSDTLASLACSSTTFTLATLWFSAKLRNSCQKLSPWFKKNQSLWHSADSFTSPINCSSKSNFINIFF